MKYLNFFALALLISCTSQNPFKEAIREKTQTEIDFKIVSVDTFRVSDSYTEGAKILRRGIEHVREDGQGPEGFLEVFDITPGSTRAETVEALTRKSAIYDSLARASKMTWGGFNVQTDIGRFYIDSAFSRVVKLD